MEDALKGCYKSTLFLFILFGIVAMSYGLFGGYVGLWSGWSFVWEHQGSIREIWTKWTLPLVPVFISPFLAFAVGSIVPSYINKDILKHSIIIGLVGSVIYIILAHFVGTIGGLGIAAEVNLYGKIFESDEALKRIVMFPMAWGIVSSTVTFVVGARLKLLKSIQPPPQDSSPIGKQPLEENQQQHHDE